MQSRSCILGGVIAYFGYAVHVFVHVGSEFALRVFVIAILTKEFVEGNHYLVGMPALGLFHSLLEAHFAFVYSRGVIYFLFRRIGKIAQLLVIGQNEYLCATFVNA